MNIDKARRIVSDGKKDRYTRGQRAEAQRLVGRYNRIAKSRHNDRRAAEADSQFAFMKPFGR